MTRRHYHVLDRDDDRSNGRDAIFLDQGDLTWSCDRTDCDPGTRRWVFDLAELAAFTIDITPRVLNALADETPEATAVLEAAHRWRTEGEGRNVEREKISWGTSAGLANAVDTWLVAGGQP